uniref:Calcium voltage-gated channel auxiliary subunit alpha2delta 1 n=1 Tax=Propithecus coquereli TaxID=379532 RepID=A0A2K6EU15_PROCO
WNPYSKLKNYLVSVNHRVASGINKLVIRFGSPVVSEDSLSNEVVYYNAKDDLDPEKNESEPGSQRIKPVFIDDANFGRQISYQHAAVHIPTDIYEGSTIVLNELNWTSALDDVFKKNREEDPSLLWQVFGSATGLARYYPGKWLRKKYLYGIFFRYIQGAASPKDMLILVDKGLTSDIILWEINEIFHSLNKFTRNTFNSNAQDVSCFQHLVQANVRNKKVLKDAVNNITAKGITDYKKGFSFAFEQLLNVSINTISFSFIKPVFQFIQVRVFTFSVGQHNYDRGPIQWMACENKAIRINTQEYLDVLGRPMVLAGDKAKQVQWTNVYLDALNQLILGVMGVDVSLEDIKRLTPRFTPIGVGIPTINLRKRRPNVQNPKSQEPVTLDFLDAELENDIKVEVSVICKSQQYLGSDASIHPSYNLALVLPTYSFYYIKAKIEETITQARYSETLKPDNFEESGYTFIAPRDYCNDLKISDNNTEFLLNFNEFIDRKTPNNPSCNIFVHLLIYLLCKGVKARFVVTDGGITRVYPKEAGENWQENPETYEDSFYKRSLDNDNYVFTVMDCVILDDGGFLLMANHDDYTNQIGRFFGEIDPSLMRHLVNISVYAFNKSYDYQSVCEPGAAPKQGAGHRSAYVVSKIPTLMNTNLIFIIVESKGTCPCDTRLLIQAEQTSDGPDPCDMVKQPRYRKGPDVCFDNNVLEDYTDCGGVSGLNPSLWSIIGIQFVLLWLVSGSKHCLL